MNNSVKNALLLSGLLLVVLKFASDLIAGADASFGPNLAKDAINHTWPFWNFIKSSVDSGVFPLWNPYVSVGAPLVGELGLGLFYPLNWLTFFMPVPSALVLIQFLTVLIAVVGMWAYLRYLAVAVPGRVLGSVLFAFAVFTESFSLTLGSSYCWMPAALLVAHRLFETLSIAATVCLSLVLALCFLAGFPNFFLYTGLVLVVYFVVYLLLTMSARPMRQLWVGFCLSGIALLLMLGLIAVQLLPAYELSGLSVRNIDAGAAYNPNSFWEAFSVKLMLRNFLHPTEAYMYANQFLLIDSGIYYMGGALLFVPLAFCSKRYLPVSLAILVSLIFLVLLIQSYQDPRLSALQSIPLVDSFRVNGRAVAYVQFLLIVLSALGLSVICSIKFSSLTGIAGRRRWLWFVVLLVVVDIGVRRENHFLVPAFVSTEPLQVADNIESIRKGKDHKRILMVAHGIEQEGLMDNVGPKYQIPAISAYAGMTQARWQNYIRYLVGPAEFDDAISHTVLQRFYGNFSMALTDLLLTRPEILDAASLGHVYSLEKLDYKANPLPRAYALSHYIMAADEAQSLELLKQNAGDLHEVVILEGTRPKMHSSLPSGSAKRIVITRYTPNSIELTPDINQSAIVVLTDAYYPGWEAWLDGHRVDILRANSLFRAVEVPAGRHTLEFRYRPKTFYRGRLISITSLLLVLVLLVGECLFYRHRSPSPRAGTDKLNA